MWATFWANFFVFYKLYKAAMNTIYYSVWNDIYLAQFFLNNQTSQQMFGPALLWLPWTSPVLPAARPPDGQPKKIQLKNLSKS